MRQEIEYFKYFVYGNVLNSLHPYRCGPSSPLSAGNRTCNKQQLKENISYVEKWPCHPACPARGSALHLESLPRCHRYTESDFKFHQLGLSPSLLSWGPSTPHDIAMAQVPILLSWAQPPHWPSSLCTPRIHQSCTGALSESWQTRPAGLPGPCSVDGLKGHCICHPNSTT